MRILNIKLVNFAGIYAAMKKREVEYDLENAKNTILLLVGDNGSGKTTILGNCHPFAYPGNMDVRNESGLIIESLTGVKEIIYSHEDNIIKIKHIYSPSASGHNIKSFINVNGEEKNPNGNVKSFKEMVELYLDVEQDYLKLTRLGSNVVGFIDMKSTERKNYSSQLLSDVDTYSQYYKKINDDARIAKGTMKSLSDKLFKLQVGNETDFRENMLSITYEMEEISKRISILKSEIIVNEYKIKKDCPNGVSESKVELKELIDKLPMVLKDINTYEKIINNNMIKKENLDKNVEELKQCEINLAGLISSSKSIRDQINELMNKYDTDKLKLSKLNGDSSREDLIILRDKLIEGLDLLVMEPIEGLTASKSELLSAYALCQNLDTPLSNIHAYSTSHVEEIFNKTIKGFNIKSEVASKISKIDKEISAIDSSIIKITGLVHEDNTLRIMYKSMDECNRCPYVKFYDDSNEKNELSVSVQSLNTKKKSLLLKREQVLESLDIHSIITNVINICRINEALLNKIPSLSFKNIWETYFNDSAISIEEHITRYIEYVELVEEKNTLENKLQQVTNELNILSSSQYEIETLKSSIAELETKIGILTQDNSAISENIDTVSQRIGELKFIIDEIEKLNEINILLTDATSTHRELCTKIDNIKSVISLVEELYIETRFKQDNLEILESNYGALEKKLNRMRYTIMQYDDITHDQAELVIRYDELNILKETLSSNKGIPLLYIQLYLKNTRIIANNLLSHIYDNGDELELSEFVINDKEFRIPYTRHGMEINDVVYASQGERSFISLAISFALMQQSLKAYNVLLLDEIDATLDQKNRGKFIQILEKQLSTIGCEQVLMITHNNVFDNYPVDILATSELEIDNYRNIGVIL